MTEQQRRPTQAPSRPVQSSSVSTAVAALPGLGNSALDCPNDTCTSLLRDLLSVLTLAESTPNCYRAS